MSYWRRSLIHLFAWASWRFRCGAVMFVQRYCQFSSFSYLLFLIPPPSGSSWFVDFTAFCLSPWAPEIKLEPSTPYQWAWSSTFCLYRKSSLAGGFPPRSEPSKMTTDSREMAKNSLELIRDVDHIELMNFLVCGVYRICLLPQTGVGRKTRIEMWKKSYFLSNMIRATMTNYRERKSSFIKWGLKG